jgi:hypothetical protein
MDPPHCKKMFSIKIINAISWYKAKWKGGANLAETQQRIAICG